MWDYSMILEVTIDRPAKDVWPYFFGEKNATWSKSEYTIVAGQEGEVGYTYSMDSPKYGVTYFFEAIRVKPEKELVVKITYRELVEKMEAGQDVRKLMGYDMFELKEVAGRTTVAFQQAFAQPLEVPEDDLGAHTESTDKFLTEIFQNLKKSVESSKQN